MNLKIEEEFSKTPLIDEINELRLRVDKLRPLSADVEGRVMQKFRLDWNFHSNAIEGNKLTHGETAAFLMEGITAKGKSLKDHLDIRGHNEAIDFMLAMINDGRPLSENDIRELHKIILVEPSKAEAITSSGNATTKWVAIGQYKTMPNHVKTSTGFIHYYATPEETPAKMHDLVAWYREASEDKSVHPLVLAALFHHRFVAIHPFDDGNGRMSRILMNLVLMKAGYPPVVIKQDDRKNYYALLNQADNNESWPFVEYIGELLKHSLNLYIKGAEGGDIDEDDDIDKELALLKMELDSNVQLKERKNHEIVVKLIESSIVPALKNLMEKTKTLDDYFYEVKRTIDFWHGSSSYLLGIGEDLMIPQHNYMSYDRPLVSKILYTINYLEFKNHDQSFTIVNTIEFRLENFKYEVLTGEGLVILSNYYQSNLSKEDVTRIIKTFIENFKAKVASVTKLK